MVKSKNNMSRAILLVCMAPLALFFTAFIYQDSGENQSNTKIEEDGLIETVKALQKQLKETNTELKKLQAELAKVKTKAVSSEKWIVKFAPVLDIAANGQVLLTTNPPRGVRKFCLIFTPNGELVVRRIGGHERGWDRQEFIFKPPFK